MTIPASTLSFGLVDARPVFMDLSDDSYFMLAPDEEAEFLRLIATGCQKRSGASLQQTLGMAHLQSIKRGECVRPQHSLLEELGTTVKAGLVDVARVAVVVHSTKVAIARQPLEHILWAPAAKRTEPLPVDTTRLFTHAARFIAARRLVPIKANCLLDSIALLRWLGETAAFASLVFGVKLDPFAAHCWVQSDSHLINDLPEHVARFEPVRVIRCSALMF